MLAVATNDINADTFAYAKKNGAVKVENTGCVIVPEQLLQEYVDLEDEYLDLQVEVEAARRLKEGIGKTYTQEEIMARYGITQADIDAAEDLEIDYE